MIQNLRQIKSRIRSVENTWKVTRAMEMISVSKLRRVQDILFASRTYFEKLDALLKDIVSQEDCNFSHPFLEKRSKTGKIALCVVTSDSGLCGMYNQRLIQEVYNFIKPYDAQKVVWSAVGKKGFTYFKRKGFDVARAFLGLHGRVTPEVFADISKYLIDIFLSGEVDEVFVATTRFEATMRYRPMIEKLLPIECAICKPTKFFLEPDYMGILNELIPFYASQKLRQELLNAFTSEHSERTVAMRSATDNAKTLMETLILLRNKVRQATITTEVLEIISSAEALKG